MLTDLNGFVSIRLPSGNFNYSVEYQGEPRLFHFNDTGNVNDLATHIKSISYHDVTELNVSLTLFQTKLSIWDVYFGNIGISGWNESNGEDLSQYYQNSTIPYYLNLFQNDTVEFEFFFEKILDHSGIDSDVFGSWNLTKDGININSSTNLMLLHQGSGLFNLSLFTEHYSAGSYERGVHKVFSVML